jgi:hypothetical protein
MTPTRYAIELITWRDHHSHSGWTDHTLAEDRCLVVSCGLVLADTEQQVVLVLNYAYSKDMVPYANQQAILKAGIITRMRLGMVEVEAG